MIISYQWLLEYLPEALPVNELSNILTSIGLEVEAVEPVECIPGGLDGLVIGEVLTCAKHPNADKLSVTTVNIGGPESLEAIQRALAMEPPGKERDALQAALQQAKLGS